MNDGFCKSYCIGWIVGGIVALTVLVLVMAGVLHRQSKRIDAQYREIDGLRRLVCDDWNKLNKRISDLPKPTHPCTCGPIPAACKCEHEPGKCICKGDCLCSECPTTVIDVCQCEKARNAKPPSNLDSMVPPVPPAPPCGCGKAQSVVPIVPVPGEPPVWDEPKPAKPPVRQCPPSCKVRR